MLPIFGGAEHEQLGDRLIWTFMQAMISQSVAVQSNPRPFVLYPFRALDFLMKQIPNAVTHAWQQRFWRASCDVYLICELHGHWIFFAWSLDSAGQWTSMDPLRWTSTGPGPSMDVPSHSKAHRPPESRTLGTLCGPRLSATTLKHVWYDCAPAFGTTFATPGGNKPH